MIASYSGSLVQSNHYYPFEISFAEGSVTSQQPYKYNGKELDIERGLNLYDYSARLMDPALGRFNTVYPKAEKTIRISPYVYCSDNPINKIDPDGRREWPVNKTYNGNGHSHENNWHAPRLRGRLHQGVDINHTGGGNTDQGAPIVATHNGTVTRVGHAGDGDGGGNRIKITSADGKVSTSYMHLDATSSGLKEMCIRDRSCFVLSRNAPDHSGLLILFIRFKTSQFVVGIFCQCYYTVSIEFMFHRCQSSCVIEVHYTAKIGGSGTAF